LDEIKGPIIIKDKEMVGTDLKGNYVISWEEAKKLFTYLLLVIFKLLFNFQQLNETIV
jgi:hypothetical protein